MSSTIPNISDNENSVAYSYLNELQRENKLTAERVSLYKHHYAKLHCFLVETLNNETTLLEQVNQLTKRLAGQKIEVEKVSADRNDNADRMNRLTEEMKQKETELERIQDHETILEMQLAECNKKEGSELAAQAPLLESVTKSIEIIKMEIQAFQTAKGRQQIQLKLFQERTKEIKTEILAIDVLKSVAEKEVKKVSCDPERIRKQTDKIEGLFKSLTPQLENVIEEIKSIDISRIKAADTRKIREDEVNENNVQLKYERDQLAAKDRARHEVLAKVEKEKLQYAQAADQKRELELQMKHLRYDSESIEDELRLRQRAFESLKKAYKKKETINELSRESLTPHLNSKEEALKDLKQVQQEITRQKSLFQEVHTAAELVISAFLKQEDLSKEKKEEYAIISRNIDEAQKELQSLKQQDHVWQQQLSFLRSQKEKIAKETSVALRMAHATQEHAYMKVSHCFSKRLEESELRKKHTELVAHQKEYNSLYQTVKTESNKYVAHIQASEQQVAKTKERHKILANEIEMLRTETLGRDRSLQRKRIELQKQVEQRDRLQSNYTKTAAETRELNEEEEKFVLQIDKLNSIVSVMRREMIRLKKNYEVTVDSRNLTGIQLVDRNDELCILWEKSNMQEKLLKKGQLAMLQKEEEIRISKIKMEETERQLSVQQKLIPQVSVLLKETTDLKQQLEKEREKAKLLILEFEKPCSESRKWRELQGEDPDTETIHAKFRVLEARLHDKKENLLEKDLVLQEITAFSEKLRTQALQEHGSTLQLSQKVDLLQQKLKEIIRKMKATISELSMYQATALKLKYVKENLKSQVENARENVAEGRPPTPNAEREFEAIINREKQKDKDREITALIKQEEDDIAAGVIRTTSESRVNAYIPQGSLGVPKAYGSHAPFMPTQAGGTMRHIRKPNPRPIDI